MDALARTTAYKKDVKMKWFIDKLVRLLQFFIALTLFSAINFFVEVDTQAPQCCGRKADFTGSHISLFSEKLFYQCPQCKKIFVLENQHKGISLKQYFSRAWRLIYMNKIGKDPNDSL